MGLYTLSCELTAAWEIAACLTLSPSHLTPQQASPTTPPNFTWWLSSRVPQRDHRGGGRGVPPAVMPAGVFWVAATPPSVPPCVHILVGVDVLLKGVEAGLKVLCCCAVAGVTEGVLRLWEWGVAPDTSAVQRHSGSLFWRDNRQSSLLILKLSEKKGRR